jgi:DNA-binding NarL/FixJ family response regulator
MLDSNLQKRDGYALLEALRDEPAFEQTPALIIIDMDSDAERNRAESLAASGVIVKSGPSGNEVARLAQEALGGEATRQPLAQSSALQDVEKLSENAPKPGDTDGNDSLLGQDANTDTEDAQSDSNPS